jgi:hypothetical protein
MPARATPFCSLPSRKAGSTQVPIPAVVVRVDQNERAAEAETQAQRPIRVGHAKDTLEPARRGTCRRQRRRFDHASVLCSGDDPRFGATFRAGSVAAT